MTTNLYVAEDGTIHRNPVTVVNNTANSENVYNHLSNNERLRYREELQVSMRRAVWFWIVSIIVSVLIGLGVCAGLGVSFAESGEDFTSLIAPYVVMGGALAGTILYGIFYAKKVYYNLWAYVLAALSAFGGIVTASIAVAIICVVAIICFYLFIFSRRCCGCGYG